MCRLLIKAGKSGLCLVLLIEIGIATLLQRGRRSNGLLLVEISKAPLWLLLLSRAWRLRLLLA